MVSDYPVFNEETMLNTFVFLFKYFITQFSVPVIPTPTVFNPVNRGRNNTADNKNLR